MAGIGHDFPLVIILSSILTKHTQILTEYPIATVQGNK